MWITFDVDEEFSPKKKEALRAESRKIYVIEKYEMIN